MFARDPNRIYGRRYGDGDRIEIIYGIVGRLLWAAAVRPYENEWRPMLD